jgi:copper homeostasis protein CutC
MILKAMQIYMPCGTKTSESDSIETLDEISEIVCKYEQSCNILLAGDLNAALLKDAPNRSKILEVHDSQSYAANVPV